MQESRLFRIVYYLMEKGKATAPELSEKFEVSVRTIYRDIDAISSAGIPVYAVQGKGGGISILDHFVLNKSVLSDQEREQILMALRGIAAAGEKGSDELLTKLAALFQVKAADWIEVDFTGWVQNRPRQDVFTSIKEAIFHNNVIVFLYFNNGGETTKRRVEPVKLLFKSKAWYLYGFCHLKNDFRYFKLTRMKELEVLPETFSRHFSVPAIEKNIEIEKTIPVTLKFDEDIAFRVYDEFTDEVTADGQGFLYVNTQLPDNDFLYSYILSFADSVEVTKPQFVRERLQKKLTDMQKKYKT